MRFAVFLPTPGSEVSASMESGTFPPKSSMILRHIPYMDWRPDRGRYDNDLKYRYVLMKGEASPKRLSELEELFEVERNQRRIDSMRQDVEKYERLVRRRAALDEQARLKAQEAEQLKRDAAKLKNK